MRSRQKELESPLPQATLAEEGWVRGQRIALSKRHGIRSASPSRYPSSPNAFEAEGIMQAARIAVLVPSFDLDQDRP